MRSRGHSPLATRSRRRTNVIPRLDTLEERRLLAVAFVETPLPTLPGSNLVPFLVTHASDGSVWTIANQFPNPLSPSDHAIRTDAQGIQSDVPGLPSGENAVALFAGDKGAVWTVTDAPVGTGHVVKLATDYNVMGSLPDAPLSAALGADGDIWTTAHHTNGGNSYSIERFDPRTGVVTSFALPSGSTTLGTIVTATDGNLWAIEPDASKVAKISTTGQITEFSLSVRPWTITPGAGGFVWIAGADASGKPAILAVTPNGTESVATTLTQPTVGYPTSAVLGLSLSTAPDGSLWFLDQFESAAGHLKVDGSLDYFPLPELQSLPGSLTTDGGTGFEFTQATGSVFVHLETDAPDPTVLLTANSIEHVEGALPSGITIASFTTTDATAFPFDFTARYQIGNQPPQTGTVLSDGNGGFVVQTSGSDPIQRPGDEFLSVTVLDGNHNDAIGAKSSGIGAVTISEAPATILGQTFAASAGIAYTGTVATLFDPDASQANDAHTSVTINWGDESSSSPTSTGSISGTGVVDPSGHVYASPGTYTVTITANHGGTISTGTSTATVTIPAITAFTPVVAGYSQGHPSEARVAIFQTTSASIATNYQTVVNLPGYGDYQSPSRIVQVGPSSFEVWATADFSSWGEQSFGLYLESQNSGQWQSVQGDAIVTPAPVTASALPVYIGFAQGTYGFAYGYLASFTSGNPGAMSSDYHATITSSDGGVWDASVIGDGNGGFLVEGDHKFPTSLTSGTFPVTVRVDSVQPGGQVSNAATLTGNASVLAYSPIFGNASGTTAQATATVAWSGTVATFAASGVEYDPRGLTATIHWGDGSPDSSGQVVESATHDDGVYTYSVAANHVFAQPGSSSTTISLSASDGEQATATGSVEVLNAPPILTGAALAGTQGQTLSGVVASFRDSSSSMPSAFAATIDWGDGTTSKGTVSTYQDQFVIYGSHVYATAGPHAYGVIMQQSGGATVTTSGTVMVAASAPASGPIGTPAGDGPVGGRPMTIVSARTIRGKHGSIRVVVTLSGTVDTNAVSNASGYVLSESVKAGKHGTKVKIDSISSATYDPASKLLTLVPKGSFSRSVAFRLALAGSSTATTVAS